MSLPFLLENDASLRVFYSIQQRLDSQRNYNQHIDTPKRAFVLTLSIKCRYADCGDLFIAVLSVVSSVQHLIMLSIVMLGRVLYNIVESQFKFSKLVCLDQ